MWNRKGQPEELVARPQAKQVVFPYMIARLHRVFFCSLNSLDSEAIGVLTSSIGYVRFGAGMLVPLQGAAAGCRCRVLLRVLLLGWCALWSWPPGAAAECCFRVLCRCIVAAGCPCRTLSELRLQGCCSSDVYALELACWCHCRVLLLQARAGCGCRVLLSKGCLHLRDLGAATGYCCERAVCAMKLRCWCRCTGWLRDGYGSVGLGP